MWAHSFHDELAGQKSWKKKHAIPAATVVDDLAKFYENISHGLLRREARATGYNLRLLSLNLDMYGGQRRCMLAQAVGREVVATRTVGAGCCHANVLAK